ncbi:MAG: RNase adaptor protein RapZ, partial [Clostridiales bacterium]|nr:RNase adaptor protein RapZ [Clostridiales bacterium]
GGMMVHIMSFGFKYGIPTDADLVFDVRFMPNPFYVPELKEHTGLEACIRNYVMDSEVSREFLKKLIVTVMEDFYRFSSTNSKEQ